MKRIILVMLIASSFAYSQSGHFIPNPVRNLPPWVRNAIAADHLESRYTLIYERYPTYLKGDFNGDSHRDAVVQIQETSTGKDGFAIIYGKKPQQELIHLTILGAGKPHAKIRDDLGKFTLWSSIPRRQLTKEPVHPPIPTVKGDVIKMQTKDGHSAFIYWDGKGYEWYASKKE